MKAVATSFFFICCALISQGQVFVQSRSSHLDTSQLLPVQVNEKWGYVNKSGKIVIPPQFVSAGVFSDGLAPVQLEATGKQGFINEKGEIVIALNFDRVLDFSGGLAAVETGNHIEGKNYVDGKWGLIDKNGRMVVNPQVDAISGFSEQLALVRVRKKWGYINEAGQIVIKPQFKWALEFSEGLAAVQRADKVGFIDNTGRFVIEPRFNNARGFSEGLAPVKNKKYGDWGFVNRMGKLVIGFDFAMAGSFSSGFAAVSTRQGNACIDKSGELVVRAGCNSLSEGLAPACMNGKCGFVDQAGTVVIEPQWDLVTDFSGGVAAVVVFTKPGFQAGDIYIPGRLSILDAVGKWGYIDRKGKYIWKQA